MSNDKELRRLATTMAAHTMFLRALIATIPNGRELVEHAARTHEASALGATMTDETREEIAAAIRRLARAPR